MHAYTFPGTYFCCFEEKEREENNKTVLHSTRIASSRRSRHTAVTPKERGQRVDDITAES